MTTLRVLAILALTKTAVGHKYLDSYLGCAWDNGRRDLQKYYRGSYTIESCRRKAAKDGLKYFGLQVGTQCFGGNRYGKYGTPGADSGCYWYNSAERSEERMVGNHGGNWRNAIFLTKEQWWVVKKDKSMQRKGTFIGCYWDNSNRQYKESFRNAKGKRVNWLSVKSVEECGNLAVKNKKTYFAVQAGHECRMSNKMFPHPFWYPATYGNSACAKAKTKKTSKKWGNFGGGNWINAIYFAKPSLYYPAAFRETPAGDDTIRLAWANSYCLNVYGAQYKKGAKIVAYHCVNREGATTKNMLFEWTKGKIRCKANPKYCITLPKAATKQELVLDKCGAKKVLQDVQLFDDMTIRFTKKIAIGFNVNGGIGGGDRINRRPIQSWNPTAANNEAFLIRSAAPPTPKPTPKPTPSPPVSGLKKGKGWSIVKGYEKGKGCTIDVSTGVPCAVSPNYPKKYSDDDKCYVKMTKTKAVKTEKFVTEKYFDIVSIGRVTMTGAHKKKHTIVLPKKVDTIKWTADFYLAGKGWKICKTKKPSLKVPGSKKKKKLGKKGKNKKR